MTKANDVFSGLGAEGFETIVEEAEDEFSSEDAVVESITPAASATEIEAGNAKTVDDNPIEEAEKGDSGSNATQIPHSALESISESVGEDEAPETNPISPNPSSANVVTKESQIVDQVVGGEAAILVSERDELAKTIQRAECIVDSWNGIKVGNST